MFLVDSHTFLMLVTGAVFFSHAFLILGLIKINFALIDPRSGQYWYVMVKAGDILSLWKTTKKYENYPKRSKAACPPPRWSNRPKIEPRDKKSLKSWFKNEQNTDQKPDQKSVENQPNIEPKSIKNRPRIHQKSSQHQPKFDQHRKMSRTSSWEPSWRPLGGVLGAS